MGKRHYIINGPDQILDLVTSLTHGNYNQQVWIKFQLDDNQHIRCALTGLRRDEGSNKRWFFDGRAIPNGQELALPVKGFYSFIEKAGHARGWIDWVGEKSNKETD